MVDASRRLPPALVAHAREFLASGADPVAPRDASTVILLRDDPLEVYLLRRHAQMAFAAGMFAFPGGRVDEADRMPVASWQGPAPAEWGRRLRCAEPAARAFVVAAVRETFEESGVLLAADGAGIVTDTTSDDWESDRAAVVERSLAFAELIDRRGLTIRSDLLVAWAHWITPAFEPRRYDTRFFVARVPPGQRARDVSGEADEVAWMAPAEAVARVDSGDMAMLPPTYRTVVDVARCTNVDDAWRLADRRVIETVVPGLAFDGDDGYLTLPDELLS